MILLQELSCYKCDSIIYPNNKLLQYQIFDLWSVFHLTPALLPPPPPPPPPCSSHCPFLHLSLFENVSSKTPWKLLGKYWSVLQTRTLMIHLQAAAMKRKKENQWKQLKRKTKIHHHHHHQMMMRWRWRNLNPNKNSHYCAVVCPLLQARRRRNHPCVFCCKIESFSPLCVKYTFWWTLSTAYLFSGTLYVFFHLLFSSELWVWESHLRKVIL